MSEQAIEYGPVATRMIFDNDDVRVWEMDLAPGAVCGLHHHTFGGKRAMVRERYASRSRQRRPGTLPPNRGRVKVIL